MVDYLAPRCRHCGRAIYHVAPGQDLWRHRDTEQVQCEPGHPRSLSADPSTRPMR